MDNRWSARKRLRQRITLEAPRIGSITAKMLDVSLGGAYVEADQRLGLPLNSPVVVAFSLPRSGQRDSFRLDAVVVRRRSTGATSTGAALMFRHMQTNVIRSLSGALSKYSSGSEARGTRTSRK